MQAEQLSLFDDFDGVTHVPCPLLGRRVAVTGTFGQGRQSLRSMLLRLGASEVRYDKLQRNTNFLLVGDNPLSDVMGYLRLYVHDGYNIRTLSEHDLQLIQGGVYVPYQVPEELNKDLRLTMEHLYWTAPEIGGLKNNRCPSPLTLGSPSVLYGKEIYVHPALMQNIPVLPQLLGCLGAYANSEMADDTDCILIPRSMPREICNAVEEYYNQGRALQFNTPFIILEDLATYLSHRAKEYPDEAFLALLEHMQMPCQGEQ